MPSSGMISILISTYLKTVIPYFLCHRNTSAYKDLVLIVFVVNAGQHRLVKLGSESPSGGECHS